MPELPADLVDAEVQAIVGRYRIPEERARSILIEVLSADPAVARALAKGTERLGRTKAWKKAVTRARKRIYAELRRYASRGTLMELADALEESPTDELRQAVLQAHVSAAERIETADEMYRELARRLDGATSIVDIGGGVQPLAFPIEELGIERYLLLERDEACVRCVRAAAHPVVEARRWSLSEGFEGIDETFDVALLLKVIPVFARQDRENLDRLRDLPARRWIVSGSAQALARREDIAHRERRVVNRVLGDLGRAIADEWRVGSELFWAVAGQ